ncbi:MAG: ACP S-malonyltransferase [Gammaproteobacteria bacterium]|nr:ACP S-malonyltransferase [Gammaproteobacteria bacterium]
MSQAFVFPGQGSQSVGMLNAFAAEQSIIQETFTEASELLGFDLWDLVANGPEVVLNQTDKTQPVMLAAGVAVWRAFKAANGSDPAFMAGHSLGEYTALVCAGAMRFEDALPLGVNRGRYMQQAVPEGTGAMAAILGLEDDQVRQVCDKAAEGEVLQPVNFNTPGQVVVAGNKGAVERALAVAQDAGAKKAILLPVSVPSHCDLMLPAADKLAAELATIEIMAPKIPVIHNADVTRYDDPDKIRDALKRQLYSPVRWVETIQYMTQQGVDEIVECGPGKVLAGLNKRIDRRMPAVPLVDQAALEKLLAS